MGETDKQEVNNYHELLMAKMKAKYPDTDFDSTNGTNSTNSLEEGIVKAFDDYETKVSELTKLEEKTNALMNLVNNSPRAAKFLNVLMATMNPAKAIKDAYGDDAYKAFLQGDATELIANIESEDTKARAENDAFEKEKSDNLAASFERLDKWGDAKGLTQEEKVDTFMRFYNILSDAVVGIYSEDLFEMGWKADHYSNDIESARREGELAGRNTKFKEQKMRRESNSVMPPSLSGQGIRAEEAKPVKKNDNPWMLD